MKIIGLTGLARSGKDLTCEIIIDQLKKKGVKAKRFALADELKADCQDFLRSKCGLDVFSKDSAEKSKFREFLVWYGNVKRQETQGKYWTSKLERELTFADCGEDVEVAIVTDIRYGIFPEDEDYWIKHRMGGKLIHISKYSWLTDKCVKLDAHRVFVKPPNEHEAVNDPKMKAAADFCIEWEHRQVDVYDTLIEDPYLVGKVNEALTAIGIYE